MKSTLTLDCSFVNEIISILRSEIGEHGLESSSDVQKLSVSILKDKGYCCLISVMSEAAIETVAVNFLNVENVF